MTLVILSGTSQFEGVDEKMEVRVLVFYRTRQKFSQIKRTIFIYKDVNHKQFYFFSFSNERLVVSWITLL